MVQAYAGFKTVVTPQNQPIPGSTQEPNNAGGFGWTVDDWARLDRFLILGSEAGTYYVGEQTLTRQNAEATMRCVKADGVRVVRRVVEISEAGRAAKNDPAIFVLAICAGVGDAETKRLALEALPKVCRYGTALLHFAEYVSGFRGWGRGLRSAIAAWYTAKDAPALAYQAVKYQSRDKWATRDLLRLAHPKPPTEQHKTIFHWITKGWESVGDEPHEDESLRLIWAFERAKRATNAKEVASLIRDHRLPREGVPTAFLKDAGVWDALMADMPMTAMIRNLATMTRVGLLKPMSEATARVVAQLGDEDRLRKARVHPIAILSALKTYAGGKSIRGDGTWEPVSQITDALDKAFYASFGLVEPTNKSVVLGLDVSGSMASTLVNGIQGLSAREACGALALVTAAVEPNHAIVAFDTAPYLLSISPRQRMDDVVKTLEKTGGGGTDCAQPMAWALNRDVKADAFIVLTDSETWQGQMHPTQAMNIYRQKMGLSTKLVVVAMASTAVTIADPNDALTLNVVGMDTATPDIIASFIRG